MKGHKRGILLMVIFFLMCLPATADTILGVPEYTDCGGCVPTGTGMILGYWAMHGYPNLFTAQGSAVNTTADVRYDITSAAHAADYGVTDVDPFPLPVPDPSTSIADFLGTGVDTTSPTIINGVGVTPAANIPTGAVGYALYRGYVFQSSINKIVTVPPHGSQISLTDAETLVAGQISENHPMGFVVDPYGTGIGDHYVPVIGWDIDYYGTGQPGYECYLNNGQIHGPVWEKFQVCANDEPYGVLDVVQINPISDSPEPTTLVLLFTGVPLAFWRLKRRVPILSSNK